MKLTEDQIIQLAPDTSSVKAGQQLASTSKWVSRHVHEKALWGNCQGSGKKPLPHHDRSGEYRFQMLLPEPEISLLALNDDGAPSYDHRNAEFFASIGIPVFACTPDLFPELMASALSKQDISQWAAQQSIKLASATQ